MNYWHTAARLLRARLREVEDGESELSSELLSAGRNARHYQLLCDDQREHIETLEHKLAQANDEVDALRTAIATASHALASGAAALKAAIPTDCAHLFGRDYVPHINLMAAHGDPDYLKANGMSIRHVDLRTTKPRKKTTPPSRPDPVRSHRQTGDL